MSAKWAKNEPAAAKRRCGMIIKYLDANGLLVPAPPGTDFTGAVFVCGATAPKFALATGTLTNQRRPFDFAAVNFTADHTTDTFTAAAHPFETGDGPMPASNAGGALPAGLVAALTDYYTIKLSANTFKLANSLANAYAGVAVPITDNGTGVHTLNKKIVLGANATERGMWGHFEYEAPQPETLHDAPETLVMVDGIVGGLDFRRMNDAGAYTTVMMESATTSLLAALLEGGHTVGDALRAVLRTHAAPFNDVGNTRTFRDMADTKDSHSGTITGSGRTTTIHDLT